MLVIEFVEDEIVFGEPPPSVCWFGSYSDLKKLCDYLESLILKGDFSVELKFDAPFKIKCVNFDNFFLKSNPKGKTLLKENQKKLITELPIALWLDLIAMIKGLNTSGQFNYIEFEGLGLYDKVNWIVKCDNNYT